MELPQPFDDFERALFLARKLRHRVDRGDVLEQVLADIL